MTAWYFWSLAMKSKTKTKPIYEKQILGAADTLQNTFNANQPGLQSISDGINSRIPALQDRGFAPDPTITAAQGYAGDAIAGKYLNNNPFVDQQAALIRNNVGDNISSRFGQTGGIGGSAFAENLGRGISEAELGFRGDQYQAERDRQVQAAALAPSLFAGQFAGVDPALAASSVGATIPYAGTDRLTSGISGLLGQYTKTKSSPGIGQFLARAASQAASSFAGGG
jgi:hypothetical protein